MPCRVFHNWVMVALKAPWLTVDLDQRKPTKQSLNLLLSSARFDFPVLTICSSSVVNFSEFQASMVEKDQRQEKVLQKWEAGDVLFCRHLRLGEIRLSRMIVTKEM